MISFETHPDRYNHWKLGFDGPVATLTLDASLGQALPALVHHLTTHRLTSLPG